METGLQVVTWKMKTTIHKQIQTVVKPLEELLVSVMLVITQI